MKHGQKSAWSDRGATTVRATVARLVWFASAVAIFVFLLEFPQPPTGRYLDTGWALALAHFMKTREQAGVDYVFTYGPLGYLAAPIFVPGLFWLKYAWAIAFAAAASFVLTRLMARLPSALLCACWLWFVLAILPQSETRYVVLLVGAPLLHVLEDIWTVRRLAFTCALLATLGLIKFTFLVFGAATLAVLVTSAPRGERRRVASVTSGLFIAFLTGLWIMAGQSVRNFPAFVTSSLEMVRGYANAMTFGGSTMRLAAAQQTLVFMTAGLLLVPPNAWLSRRRLPGIALLSAGLFLAWKEGFVRQDTPHEAVFFGFTLVSSLLARALDPPDRSDERPLRVAFLALTGLASVGALRNLSGETPSDWWTLARPRQLASLEATILRSPRDHLRYSQDVWRSEQKQWLLPAIRERVGAEGIDVTSFDQMTIFWNAFNWRHRPAFQGYAAYTPELARRNAEFLMGPSAPRYVLAMWMTIDDRYPPEDDGLFLIELIRRYRPAVSEREYILLERREPAAVQHTEGSIVERRSVYFGEPILFDADVKNLTTLSVHVKRTLAGSIQDFLYRPPKVYVDVELSEGPPHRYSFVPGLSRAEFVVNPFVEANVDLYPIYGGIGRRVKSFMLTTNAEGRRCFGESFDITVRCYGEHSSRCD